MRCIRLKYLNGVTRRHRAIISKAVDWLRPQVDHCLPILVVPHPVITHSDGGYGFGVFVHEDGKPRILLATGAYGDVKKSSGTEGADRFLIQTLFHEFVHYQQFAKGKPIIERGVEVRAKNMVNAYLGARHGQEERRRILRAS